MAQLTCSRLKLGYDGHTVLSGLDFSVDAGNYLCIVGENGSGKSTLMKTILGLIRPEGGKITWGEGLRENEIGYLPQQTVVQKDFPATVREIVLSGCQGRAGRRPFYSREEKELARQSMERMGPRTCRTAAAHAPPAISKRNSAIITGIMAAASPKRLTAR